MLEWSSKVNYLSIKDSFIKSVNFFNEVVYLPDVILLKNVWISSSKVGYLEYSGIAEPYVLINLHVNDVS